MLYSSLAELRGHLAQLRDDPQLADRIAGAGQALVSGQLSHEQLAARQAVSLWQRLGALLGLRKG
jgi:hypothetical protein